MKTIVKLLFLCFYLLVCGICSHASACSSSSRGPKKIKLYTAQINKNNSYGSIDIASSADDDLLCNIEDEDDEYESKKQECLSRDVLKILWPIFLNGSDSCKGITHHPKTIQQLSSPLYIAQRVLRI